MATITQDRADSIADCYAATGFKNKSLALRNAGYKKSYANSGNSKHLYENILVKEAIEKKKAEIRAETVASRKQRQNFWTRMMSDPEASNSDKLRASELLGKSEADFTDKIQTSKGEDRVPLTEGEKAIYQRFAHELKMFKSKDLVDV